MVYRLYESPPERFRQQVFDFFFAHDGLGVNVTLPHKRSAADFVNELTPRAEVADAVNTIARREGELVGDNTDGVGLIRDLRGNLGLRLEQRRILMLGAGGAARGVLGPLLELRPELLVIANRTATRADELAADFDELGPVYGVTFGSSELREPFDLVINATSASLKGEMPPIPTDVIGPGSVAYDMYYGVGETAFTQWARDAGAATVAQGWGMLVEQAAESFEIWRGVRPETPPVLTALRERAALTVARTPS
jgi:shikimate dehydrogenase